MGAGAKQTDCQGQANSGPLRQCAVTRARKPPEELIRFVASPEGAVVPDLARHLPGRGVWVDATHAAVAAAVRQKTFARSLQRPVAVPADLPTRVERLMARRLSEALSLANKAGLIVAGFAKIEALMARKRAVVLIHAGDAAADGVEKLDRKFNALTKGNAPQMTSIRDLSAAEMSLAMGRPNVIHAAAAEGGATRRLIEEARRLRRYRLGQEASGRVPTPVNTERRQLNTGRA
jgi:predicted RNA-binding protein YlxR (DUF448 family)